MVPHASAMEGKLVRTILRLFLLTGVGQAAHPLVEVLRKSPEVASVELPIVAPRCIIHIRNWHWVPLRLRRGRSDSVLAILLLSGRFAGRAAMDKLKG